jgi:hypothetical protein
MNRRLFGALGVIAVLTWAGACKEDPLSDLDGNPAAVTTNFSNLQLAIGGEQTIRASIVDARATPLAVPITFSACSADITVTEDPDYHPIPATSAQAIVTAVTANPSCVVVSGGGVSDTITVAVLPLGFGGTASTTTPQVGQLFTLNSTTVLKFDTLLSNVDFGGGALGEVVSRTRDELVVRVPQTDVTQPATLTVTDVDVTYVPGLRVDLATLDEFDVQSFFGDRETLGTATITIPADGAADLVFYDGFRTGEPIDYFYQYTLPGADTLTFTVEWAGGSDVDVLNCNAACSAFVGGFGAATGANPESYTVIFTAGGTFQLLIEQFDDHDDPARIFKVTIRNP